MDTLADQRQALIDDVSIITGDQFYDKNSDYALIDRFINRAVKWVANQHDWEQTQRSIRFTATLANDETDEYWNYPENFKTDSIYKVAVASAATDLIGADYKILTWSEYLNHRENYNGSKKVASDHRRQVHIYPIVADGSTISFWGHEIPDTLSNTTDTHPFGDEANLAEAIHLYALGLMLRKARGSYFTQGRQLQAEAQALVAIAIDNQLDKQAQYRTEHAEMFEHTDFLEANGARTQRGNFNTC